jgi:hypothetical protein
MVDWPRLKMKRGTMRTNLRACRASYGRYAYGRYAYGRFAYGRFAYGRFAYDFAYYHHDDAPLALPFDDAF